MGCKQKVNELKKRVAQLELELRKYKYDHLTGLPLRRDFELDVYSRLIAHEDFYIIMFDVNDLHRVNREEGYKQGDMLLRVAVASMLDVCKTMYRIGGDEFACIVDEIPDNIDSIRHVEYGISKSGKGKTIDDMIIEADSQIIKKKKRKMHTKER